MWPVLFEYGGAAVTSYSFLMGIAILVGLGMWTSEARRFSLPVEPLIGLAIKTVLVSLAGARIAFMIVRWEDFARGSYRVWALWEGGVVFYGGFLAGLAFLLWALPRHGLKRAPAINALAPGMAVGHAIGRVGCFLNGCCYGSHCDLPWAVVHDSPLTIAPRGVPLHPVQLYEALALVVIAVFCLVNNRRLSFLPTWALYIALYAPTRFALEFVRDDPERGTIAGFSTSQWVSLGLFFVCVFLAFTGAKGHNTPHESRYREPRRP